jgi:SAM-dependent methyltransferase
MAGVFSDHYTDNGWDNAESRSGEGSTLQATEAVRAALPKLISDYDIATVLDIPCGDFNWMSQVDLPAAYIGGDLVAEIVARNRQLHASDARSFLQLDLTADDLPPADLIFCRDCLVHLSYEHIHAALANIRRSQARFLLTTTHVSLDRNRNIVTGDWRRLNLQAAPFFLPEPLQLIDERSTNPAGHDKRLGLWRVGDIPETSAGR